MKLLVRGAMLVTMIAACASRDTDLSAGRAPPVLSLGHDAYLDWKRWPVLRIGQRSIVRSTYDRSGGNHGSDASHFIRQDQHGFATVDLAGSGVLAFVRTNHWHGSPWQYVVDGRATTVSETSTASPDHPVVSSKFLPESAFPPPLAVTWSTTNGADLSWVPIPFERSFELAYGRTHYGTGYYIIHLVAEGSTDVKTPLRAWDASPPPSEVLALLARAGTDLSGGEDLSRSRGVVNVPGNDAPTPIATIGGPGTLRALRFVAPASTAQSLARARLVVTWDGRAQPSIDAPLPLFFGTGTLYDRDGKESIVRAFPVNATVGREGRPITLASYFPMPFARGARIALRSAEPLPDIAWEIAIDQSPPETPFGLFHATYRDHGLPTKGSDLVLLDTAGVEGEPAWCGTVVGTSLIFSDTATLTTLEGDPRFFFDDSESPQVQGTGTEEWGGGGDYWGGRTMTLPFAGHPVGAPSAANAKNADDLVESMYRFLLGDAMPFGRRARLHLEHGGLNDSIEHYRSVAYWYGWPDACLVESDAIDIGNVVEEARHGYTAADGSTPYTLESRYELGLESPLRREDGRIVRTASEITVALPRNNVGALLRRTLDYDVPDQRAEVFVAPVDEHDRVGEYERAGTWFTAGAARSLYSFPREELDAPVVEVETSDRRLREDEFLIARRFTQGRTRVRLRFVVSSGGAWTELRYRVYGWTIPSTVHRN